MLIFVGTRVFLHAGMEMRDRGRMRTKLEFSGSSGLKRSNLSISWAGFPLVGLCSIYLLCCSFRVPRIALEDGERMLYILLMK